MLRTRLLGPALALATFALAGAGRSPVTATTLEPQGDPAAPSADTPADAPDAETQPDVDGTAAPLRFESPRELFEHFLTDMKAARDEGSAERLRSAARVFDEWASDAGIAEDLARDLYNVLNRTERVDLATVPGAGSVDADRSHWIYDRESRADPSVRVRLQLERDGGGWFVPVGESGRIRGYAETMAGVPLVSEVIAEMALLARLRHEIRTGAPEMLRSKAFLLENWQWVGLALLLFLAVALDFLMRRVLGRLVRRAMRAESQLVPTDELDNFERPFGILVSALLFRAFTPVLGLEPDYATVIDVATGVVAVAAGIWASYRLVDVLCGFLERKAGQTQNKFDDVLVPLLRRTLKILLTIVALFYLASKWTEDLWGVVAGLSIGSLAIGFAARDSIENLFGTFTVLLDKPFQLGDWITVGEIDGTVEEVGFRSTRVRTFYNSLITVPNRTFISAHVDNWGRRSYRRFKSTLALTYDTPPEKIEAFCEGVRELIRLHPCTRKDYYHVYLNAFGDSSLDVLLYMFFSVDDWAQELRERHRLMNDIVRLAQRLGVSFAFPSRSVYMVDAKDLEHPDAPASDSAAAERGKAEAGEIAGGREKLGPVEF